MSLRPRRAEARLTAEGGTRSRLHRVLTVGHKAMPVGTIGMHMDMPSGMPAQAFKATVSRVDKGPEERELDTWTGVEVFLSPASANLALDIYNLLENFEDKSKNNPHGKPPIYTTSSLPRERSYSIIRVPVSDDSRFSAREAYDLLRNSAFADDVHFEFETKGAQM